MAWTSKYSTRWWRGPLSTTSMRLVGFDGASSLKQQSEDRHVDPLGHIILIPSQPVFVLSLERCVLSGESTNTNLIVFGLTQSGSVLKDRHWLLMSEVIFWYYGIVSFASHQQLNVFYLIFSRLCWYKFAFNVFFPPCDITIDLCWWPCDIYFQQVSMQVFFGVR
jgi:hypothetical protein